MLNKKIGFIGGGAMAEALISGLVKASLVAAAHITVSDISRERLTYLRTSFGVKTTGDSAGLAAGADLLCLTVKPQVISDVLSLIAPVVAKTTTVVSVAAGVTIATLQDKMPEVPIVRVMPNTPVAVGEGMAALALGKYAGPDTGELVAAMFSSVGRAVTVEEKMMDAVTGLSGSGPAYAFLMIDALADGGVLAGLPRQTAITLAAQTLLGASRMVLATGEHPAKLRDMVTSPGGTTIAGVHKLEQQGVRGALIDAVQAASERSREMGKQR